MVRATLGLLAIVLFPSLFWVVASNFHPIIIAAAAIISLVAILIGAPLLYALRSHMSFLACVIGGTAVAVVASLALFVAEASYRIKWEPVVILAVIGACGGAAFWLLGVWRNPFYAKSISPANNAAT